MTGFREPCPCWCPLGGHVGPCRTLPRHVVWSAHRVEVRVDVGLERWPGAATALWLGVSADGLPGTVVRLPGTPAAELLAALEGLYAAGWPVPAGRLGG